MVRNRILEQNTYDDKSNKGDDRTTYNKHAKNKEKQQKENNYNKGRVAQCAECKKPRNNHEKGCKYDSRNKKCFNCGKDGHMKSECKVNNSCNAVVSEVEELISFLDNGSGNF